MKASAAYRVRLEQVINRKLTLDYSAERLNRTKTAKELSINLSTLWRKMKKYNIQSNS